MAGNSELILKSGNHQSDVALKLHSLLAKEILVDSSLISAEGRNIKVHRLILSASSKFFEGIFVQYPANRPVTIKLKNIRMEDLQPVIEFIYTGEVRVSRDQLPSLLKTADSLQIKGLAEQVLELDVQFATPEVESAENDEMTTFDNNLYRQRGERDCLIDSEKLQSFETGESERNYEEFVEESDEGKSQISSNEDPAEFLSQHSSLDGLDFSNDLFDGDLAPTAIAGPSQPVYDLSNTKSMSQGSSSSTKTGLNARREISDTEKPFKCTKCGRAYTRKKSMQKHLLYECGVNPRFQCSLCEYRSLRKQDLQKHLTRVHKVDPSQFAAFGAGTDFTLHFKCGKCQQTFKFKRVLDSHLMNVCHLAA